MAEIDMTNDMLTVADRLVSEAKAAAESAVDDLIRLGLTKQGAASIQAQALMHAGWTLAAQERRDAGVEPNPDRFIEVAAFVAKPKYEWRVMKKMRSE